MVNVVVEPRIQISIIENKVVRTRTAHLTIVTREKKLENWFYFKHHNWLCEVTLILCRRTLIEKVVFSIHMMAKVEEENQNPKLMYSP
jgi:hypothetical protein